MTHEEHLQKVNETIASCHRKRRGEDGITFDEAVEQLRRMGYTEGDAHRWLRADPPRK